MRSSREWSSDLRFLFGDPRGRRAILIYCPFHDNYDTPSCAVYWDHAYCFGGCGYIDPARLLEALEQDERDLPTYSGERETATQGRRVAVSPALVEVWQRILFGPRADRLAWLAQRGFWTETIRRYRLGHDGLRFVIPILDTASGDVLGVKFRADPLYADPEQPKYEQPRGQQALVYRPLPQGEPTVVCEGELDALLLAQYGYDAVTATCGAGSLARVVLPVLPERGLVYVATDQDDEGERAAGQLLRVLGKRGRRVWFPGKDVCEALAGIREVERAERLRQWFEEEEV